MVSTNIIGVTYRMKSIAIGSYALCHYFDLRTPKDMDVVIHFNDLDCFISKYSLKSIVPVHSTKFHGIDKLGKHYEIEVAGIDENSSATLLYELADQFTEDECEHLIPPASLLYQIKMCHRFKFGPHFEKTRSDILFLRDKVDTKINPSWKKFLKARKEEAARKTPRLKGISKDGFFVDKYGDVVQIEHDTIHLTQALDRLPAYTNFQVGEVECSMKKFFEVDEQIRLNAVFEESASLAIERAIWPSNFKVNELKAFKGSLQRLCCHISSGKFRDYAWENYDKVLAMYKKGDIISRFKKGIDNGVIIFKEGELV